jgi:hypothetical protein
MKAVGLPAAGARVAPTSVGAVKISSAVACPRFPITAIAIPAAMAKLRAVISNLPIPVGTASAPQSSNPTRLIIY